MSAWGLQQYNGGTWLLLPRFIIASWQQLMPLSLSVWCIYRSYGADVLQVISRASCFCWWHTSLTSGSQLLESSILLSGRVEPSQSCGQEILSGTDIVQDEIFWGIHEQECWWWVHTSHEGCHKGCICAQGE